MSIDELLKIDPYSLNKAEKEELFSSFLSDLSEYHYAHCTPYQRIMNGIGFDPQSKHSSTDMPFLPVQLFKTNELRSASGGNNVKTLSSSGTSGHHKSRVYLDRENAANQTKVLIKIASSFIGSKRMPMIIIDSENTINDRTHLSANAAGVLGFSVLGSKRAYVLNEEMELKIELLHSFLNQHQGERVLLFGFTFKVFHSFYKALLKLETKPDLSNAVLIHGGGWKKLERESVSSAEFRNKLNEVCGIRQVHDYYGMAEQMGSVYMECESGHYHASVFSDIIIRRALDFSVADIGEEGIIQVLSLLPKSYPGHSLLTDDTGILLGEDDCSCHRKGKYFKITGRLKNAELKGCSDSYE
jgi:phenylacetate-coenzyme A ligase PaaK-like adenylate-forming protein